MVIKQPFFKLANDGSELIRVDVPNDIEFLEKPSISQKEFIAITYRVETIYIILNTLCPVNIDVGTQLYV